MGPSRVLHLMNPLRHDFIAECLAESKQNGSEEASSSSEGLRYLDVGCGGGIFAESLARTIPLNRKSSFASSTNAASILAIDPSSTLIKIARDHARRDPAIWEHMRSGRFRYENTTVEALSEQSTKDTSGSSSSSAAAAAAAAGTFDVITLFEVIEHVDPKTSSPLTFLKHCLRLLRPGGWLIGSTIARTVPSYVVNKVVAEAPWPIGVVPRGTHEWSKFVNADELRGWVEEALAARRAGSEVPEGMMKWKCAGVVYIPGWGWKMVKGGEDWGNYFWAVRKAL